MDKDEFYRQHLPDVDLVSLEAEIEVNSKTKVDSFIATLPRQFNVSRSKLELNEEDRALYKRVVRVVSRLSYGGAEIKVGMGDEFTRHQSGSTVFVYAVKYGRSSYRQFLLPWDSDDLIEDAVFNACLELELEAASKRFLRDGVSIYPRRDEDEE